jgi:transcriptional regulator with XRE-family HTH domain
MGALVARLRNELDLTQSQLAERSGVSTKRLGELERGVPNVRVMTAVNVAEALGIPPYSLFAPDGFVPPNADPALIRHYHAAYEAIRAFGQALGLPPPESGTSTLSERPSRQKRSRSKSKKS